MPRTCRAVIVLSVFAYGRQQLNLMAPPTATMSIIHVATLRFHRTLYLALTLVSSPVADRAAIRPELATEFELWKREYTGVWCRQSPPHQPFASNSFSLDRPV